jgi:ABC-type Fe3+/spermidine/putrescine transport system ATPase subunit
MIKMALIELRDLTKKYDDITALNRINLTVEDGEYLCILGPTGAGKTTLLRIVAGLLSPDQGRIFIDGTLVNSVPPEERNAIYMYQQFALFPHMNVWQNVSFSPEIKDMNPRKIEELTSEILEMVRLAHRKDAYPHELSGGMQQRVALARAIASGSRILLLDEPLGALDARLRVTLRTQLKRLVKDQKLTAVHVTHDQEEALMIADKIIVLRNGEIVQIGSPHEIYSKPNSIFTINFVGGANFIEGQVKKTDDTGIFIEMRGDITIRVNTDTRNVGERIVVAIRLEDVSIGTKEELDANNLSGTIQSVTFVGDSMEYGIRLANDILLSSRILFSEDYEPYEVGENVTVSFLPEKCYVFPYPKAGILKEIEAI